MCTRDTFYTMVIDQSGDTCITQSSWDVDLAGFPAFFYSRVPRLGKLYTSTVGKLFIFIVYTTVELLSPQLYMRPSRTCRGRRFGYFGDISRFFSSLSRQNVKR
ncbi:hypothetical protein PoB_004208000 [Plakobranchus ocellatus]|uniref:Uncharacterized protein n=1 Tax=Plakobranchus ocellatus TaxID=259542 RepID=A0AAV4B7R0_9GAST|nr:hypothetical protein PoB_004208000 [Plakobranchus ocellatus]